MLCVTMTTSGCIIFVVHVLPVLFLFICINIGQPSQISGAISYAILNVVTSHMWVYSLKCASHSHKTSSLDAIRPGKLFHISARFFWDLPSQIPFKQWHAHFGHSIVDLPSNDHPATRKWSKWLMWNNKSSFPGLNQGAESKLMSWKVPWQYKWCANITWTHETPSDTIRHHQTL